MAAITLARLADVTSAVLAAHGCQISRDTSDFALGNNTFTAVQWNAADSIDTDAMHDPASNNTRITIPTLTGVTTGLWRFTTYGYTTATSPRTDVKFRKNATTDSPIIVGPTTVSGVGAFHASWIGVLAAADYIEVFLRTTAGSFSLVATDATARPFAEATFLGKVT